MDKEKNNKTEKEKENEKEDEPPKPINKENEAIEMNNNKKMDKEIKSNENNLEIYKIVNEPKDKSEGNINSELNMNDETKKIGKEKENNNNINKNENNFEQKVEDAESDWCCKEDITEKMIQFFKDKNDSFLLSNSKFIMEGLRKLNEKLTFTELEIYNNIGTDLIIELPLKPVPTNNEGNNRSKSNVPTQGNNLETEGSMSNGEQGNNKVYSLDDIIDAFSNYMTLGPPNVLDYKA